MAGGRSERMRASRGELHKALVPILGVPMIERNLCRLLATGFRRIHVAVAAAEAEIVGWVASRGRSLARAVGAELTCYEERSPLGSIGAVRELAGEWEAMLIVNVDNLTTLDLPAMVEHHLAVSAAATVASHLEPFRNPFGEVRVRDGWVREYVEKPVRRIRVSSGTYVLSPRALPRLRRGAPTMAFDLFRELLERGEPVADFPHRAHWIDVNDDRAVARAEALIRRHCAEFETWRRPPDSVVAAVLATDGERVALRARSPEAGRYRGLWDLPGVELDPDGGTGAARRLGQERGWGRLRPLISFDDLDVSTGRLLRHHLYDSSSVPAPGDAVAGEPDGASLRWLPLGEVTSSLELSPPARRALACRAAGDGGGG